MKVMSSSVLVDNLNIILLTKALFDLKDWRENNKAMCHIVVTALHDVPLVAVSAGHIPSREVKFCLA
jgi:hypothetical protein